MMNTGLTSSKRTFPPLYTASGDERVDRLAFFHLLERLKTQKRTGWLDNNIPDAESISDHMYRMAILAMCISDETLDVTRCVMLALVHDLAEAQVGDITPREGISKVEKQRLERNAMKNITHDMLHNSPAARKIEALWEVNKLIHRLEYEGQSTAEARFIKDLDRFEMAAQAAEYEVRYQKDLQSFFESSLPKICHPDVRAWGDMLQVEREKSLGSDQNTGERMP